MSRSVESERENMKIRLSFASEECAKANQIMAALLTLFPNWKIKRDSGEAFRHIYLADQKKYDNSLKT